MYNTLLLKESEYPYSLFLYNDTLQVGCTPEIWVMLVAWYGVAPTGNQAGHVIELLVKHADHNILDQIYEALVKGRFVDDIASGTQTEEKRSIMIQQVKKLLSEMNFKIKFIALSGEDPPPEASSDGIHMKVLGYVWAPRLDFFSPGMGEINFNKKVRGSKKPNVTPIETIEDVKKIMDPINITKRNIAAKVAELYDPTGVWEPLKLQLKLEFTVFNGRKWDDSLTEEEKSSWVSIIQTFLDIPNLRVRRCVIPENAINLDLRLICVSDAAKKAENWRIHQVAQFLLVTLRMIRVNYFLNSKKQHQI